MAIWGGTFVIGRIIAQTMTPFTAGFGRFAIASIFLWLLIIFREEKLPRLNQRQILLVVCLGFSGVLTYNLFFFLVPLFTIIFGTVFLQESLSTVILFGGGLVILGVSLVNRQHV